MEELVSKINAIRQAKDVGCYGAHKSESGEWFPCSSFSDFINSILGEEVKSSRISFDEISSWRSRRKRRGNPKKKRSWEKLGERGITGIDTIEGGGLVSAGINSGLSTKSINYAPINNNELGFKITRTIVSVPVKKRIKSINEELGVKSIGPKIRKLSSLSEPFDPNAVDGDNDGVVQDGTAFQRPANPVRVVSPPKQVSLSDGQIQNALKLIDGMSPKQKENFLWPPIDAFDTQRPGYKPVNPKEVSSRVGLASSSKVPDLPNVVDNPQATPKNPFNNLGGKAMGQIILGRVKPQHRDKKQKTMFFIGGTTGSGKSRVVEHLQKIGILPNDDEAAHIDPDFIKMGLPGFNDGLGAENVHGQSRSSTDYVINDAANAGMDMIVEGTGKRAEHPSGAKRRGDKVSAHYVYAPTNVAESRMDQRAKTTGRKIGTWLAGQIASEIPREISRMISSGSFDEFYIWDNSGDIDAGELPKLIASKSPGKPMEILDKQKFYDFAGGQKQADTWETMLNEQDSSVV